MADPIIATELTETRAEETVPTQPDAFHFQLDALRADLKSRRNHSLQLSQTLLGIMFTEAGDEMELPTDSKIS
jgi:hypothetical protein